jgi:hypothetical protein
MMQRESGDGEMEQVRLATLGGERVGTHARSEQFHLPGSRSLEIQSESFKQSTDDAAMALNYATNGWLALANSNALTVRSYANAYQAGINAMVKATGETWERMAGEAKQMMDQAKQNEPRPQQPGRPAQATGTHG